MPNNATASFDAGERGGPLLEVACGDVGAEVQALKPTAAARPPMPANADRRVTLCPLTQEAHMLQCLLYVPSV